MTSLAVVDLSPLFRAGLSALVKGMGFDPVHEAADLDDLQRRGDDGERPDMVLIGLPAYAEVAPLMRRILDWSAKARVVFLAPTLEVQALASSFRAGAYGYLVDSISREALNHSLRLVAAGERVFPSQLTDALIPEASHPRPM